MKSRTLSTPVTETEFQAQVVELATITGWRHLHVRRSVGRGKKWVTATNLPGWPDLVLMRPPHELLFRELKVPGGIVSQQQAEMLAFLDQFPFCSAGVWWPSDWDEIQRTLARRPRPV